MKNTRNITARSLAARLLAVVLAITVAALPGCRAAQGGADGTALPSPTPSATAEPAPGGRLYMPIGENTVIEDPYAVNTEEAMGLYSLVFEGLVRVDYAHIISPCLAENWSVDETGRIWTLNLRQNVSWHQSSKALDAQDVKYTWDRLKEAGEESYYYYHAQKIQDVVVIDADTVQVIMKRPGISALYSLTFPILCAEGGGANMRGTGPYQVSSSVPNRIELTANERWWRSAPYIKEVVFEGRVNNETALASYQAGQLNFVPTDLRTAGKYREEGVSNVLDVMTQQAELLVVNYETAALGNVNVRKAIAYAIDRGELVSNVYMNRAQTVDVPIAPDSWLYESKSKVYDYDPAAALELMKEAGWVDSDGDGILESVDSPYTELTLKLLVNETADNTARSEAAAIIAGHLGEIGVKVAIESAAFTLGDDESGYIQRLNSGDFDMALIGLNLPRDCDFTPLMGKNGVNNFGGYSNAAMDILIQNMVTAATDSDFRDAASAFQLQFIEELPFIMLYFRLNSIVYSDDIQGVGNVREPELFYSIEKWYMKSGQ